MKKVISIVLMLSMILLSTATVFAADTAAENEYYDLSKLFVDYDEKSLSEMVKYIDENQQIYGFVEFFRNYVSNSDSPYAFPLMTVYVSGDYHSAFVWEAFYSRLTDEHSKYIVLNYSRPSSPAESTPLGTVMLGEKGDKCFWIDFTDEFLSYVRSLNRLDGNIVILDFLMNLLSGDVVGISFNWNDVEKGYAPVGNKTEANTAFIAPSVSGDCNGDVTVNAVDGNLMRRVMSGNGCKVDPFAVDVNADGELNAVDSLFLKKTIIEG